jgi:Flp pilus assembly protein CpaB
MSEFLMSSRSALSLRAAVGGLLVTLALLGVSQAYAHADRPPHTGVVVAARTLAPGTVLHRDDLDLVPADLPATTAGRAFTSTEALAGAVTLAPLAPGEPVLLSQVLPTDAAPPSGVDLSFAVTADRALGGSILPGERVDLVATLPAGGTRLVARAALVIGTSNETDGLLSDTGRLVVTVRLPSRHHLLDLVAAVDEGQLTLARAPLGGAT